ncbi:MAG: hypothetical protein ACOYEV_03890 [Candidatus Nanopelagicales bacterium]
MSQHQWLPAAPGQPIVALDFDGVLNVVSGKAGPPPGYTAVMVELDRRTWPTHPYIAHLPDRFRGPIRHQIVVNPAHGEMVRRWQSAGALVVWATTWERAILPHAQWVGIPELPVLEISQVIPDSFPSRTADWKFQGLCVGCQGHPLVWVDDMADGYREQGEFGSPPAPLLVIAPDERVGLTASQNDLIEGFLAAQADR